MAALARPPSRGGSPDADALAVATVAAAVQGKFPRDRKRQNVFFDKLRAKRVADEDDSDEDDGDDEV